MTDTSKQNVTHTEAAPSVPSVHHTEEKKLADDSPAGIAAKWAEGMQAAFDSGKPEEIHKQFLPGKGLWRDILTIDQGDFQTLRENEIVDTLNKFGVPKIKSLKITKPLSAAIVPASPELTWLQAFFTFETEEARGLSFVRLVETTKGQGDWKAFTFYTALDEFKGHEEFSYHRRPLGTEHGKKSNPKVNWLDKRKATIEFKDQDPTVLIIGGGQNGLMLAARFSALGIPHLVLDKGERVGDAWRKRYHSLALHDPVWADYTPYVQFPPHWPIYSPKDKIANWFECYAEIMELNVWLKSTIERNPTYDSKTKTWTVSVVRDGAAPRKMKIKHLVLATGFSGEPRLPSNFAIPGKFKGTITHSSGHKGSEGWEGKNAVVIGCCNSGHDIAQSFAENGVNTTIVQRSHTYVMSSEHGIPGLLNGTYEEDGPPLDEADISLASLPVDLLNEFHIGATKDIAVKDKELLDGLKSVGFKINPYPGGLFIKYFREGGGYYIDVGASGMIIDGTIKLKQGHQIKELSEDGVIFDDGEEIKADIVVCATGYSSQRETIRKLISDDVADRIGACWGEDTQGEIPGVWRHSGVDRFYLQSGNMFQARVYSKFLALSIQQQELGLSEPKFPAHKKLASNPY